MIPFLLLAVLLSWPLQILVYHAGVTPAALDLPLLALANGGPSLAAIVLTRASINARRTSAANAPPRWRRERRLRRAASVAIVVVVEEDLL